MIASKQQNNLTKIAKETKKERKKEREGERGRRERRGKERKKQRNKQKTNIETNKETNKQTKMKVAIIATTGEFLDWPMFSRYVCVSHNFHSGYK